MGIAAIQHKLTIEQSKIILTLAYFDLFKFPLTVDEIIKFSKITAVQKDLCNEAIMQLLEQNIVFKHGPYFSLIDDDKLEHRRVNGQKNANALMLKANTYAGLIHKFPFVRSVCISGSLSKGCVDEQGDIDYFIITEPRRLWITRSMLIAFKKIFLLNNHKYFCVNYFVDTEHLNIPDKNIFTATELLTLLPMSGFEVYNNLIKENQWAFTYLPNAQTELQHQVKNTEGILKRLLENIFKGNWGDWLDTHLMKLTIKKWRAKFKSFNDEELDTAMRSRKYVSKHHPQQFQQVVLNRYSSSITQVQEKFNITLHD